ncbi:MAG: hypothetical protein ACYC3O_03295 [Burkholderiales bacterium]
MPIKKSNTNKVDLELDMESIYFEYIALQSLKKDFLSFSGSREQFINAGIPLTLFPDQSNQRKTVTKFAINGRKASLKITYLEIRREFPEIEYELLWEIPEKLWPQPDPGIDTVIGTFTSSPANYQVGDLCIYWKPGHSAHCERMEITKPFSYYAVKTPRGRYFDERNYRFDYCLGYWARAIGERPLFYEAHELRDIDFRVRHIRLLKNDDTDTISFKKSA